MQKPLETTNHRCHISEAGVTMYPTDKLEEEDDYPTDDELLQLAPTEAIEAAKYILAHESELLALQPIIDEHCEMVSREVLAAFPDALKKFYSPRHLSGGIGFYAAFKHALHTTLTYVRNNEESRAAQWMHTPAYRHTITQRETLFWRYFNKFHKERLMDEYLPDDERE